jgi:hypothetical protein
MGIMERPSSQKAEPAFDQGMYTTTIKK